MKTIKSAKKARKKALKFQYKLVRVGIKKAIAIGQSSIGIANLSSKTIKTLEKKGYNLSNLVSDEGDCITIVSWKKISKDGILNPNNEGFEYYILEPVDLDTEYEIYKSSFEEDDGSDSDDY